MPTHAAAPGASAERPTPPGGSVQRHTSPAEHIEHRVPATLVRRMGAVGHVLVAVTIRGKPYSMVLDTGAPRTDIDVRLATRLGLPRRGRPHAATSFGSVTRAQPVALTQWRTGSLALPPIVADATRTAPYAASGGRVVGLLGTDVLARFGSLRIDYDTGRVTLGATAPAGGRSFPMKVLRRGPGAKLAAEVNVRGRTLRFALDTGSPHSSIAIRAARRLGLREQGKPRRARGGFGGVQTVQPVMLDRWSLGSVVLPRTLAFRRRIPPALRKNGIVGPIGQDVFSRFGTLYLDFDGRRGVLK